MVRFERTTSVAVGHYPSEGEGANLIWCLAQGTRSAPSTLPGPCGPILLPGHSVLSACPSQQACSSLHKIEAMAQVLEAD